MEKTVKTSIHDTAAALRGYGQLVADATIGLAHAAESLHHSIVRLSLPFGAAPTGGMRGITGLVYASVQGGAHLAGRGLEVALARLAPLPTEVPSTRRQQALRAALNGVYGDHLAATGNPLQIPMRFRRDGKPLSLTRAALTAAIPDAGGNVLVLVHGLCSDDLHWRRNGHDHGAALADDLGFTPVYLHYNSGRPIAQNGAEFAAMVETLVTQWPVPVEDLTIIGHSMGGLLARSAVEAARTARYTWRKRLRRLVFLGTPHQGALLEQLGSGVVAALRSSPYSAPFARLGAARSAGITDLRHGSLRGIPLPAGVQCFAIAATLGASARLVRDKIIGDGLVSLDSALGRHRHQKRRLAFPPARQWIARHTTHLDLLSRREVYSQLREWLAR